MLLDSTSYSKLHYLLDFAAHYFDTTSIFTSKLHLLLHNLNMKLYNLNLLSYLSYINLI